MKLVYIAGAYRAKTLFEVEANIRRARERAVDVVRAGHYPVVPHLCTGFMDGLAPDEHFLAGARDLLAQCDEVWLVKGWEASRGTLAEIAWAFRNHKPVYNHDQSPLAATSYLRAFDIARERIAIDDTPEPAPI